jgi:hypothetical protein
MYGPEIQRYRIHTDLPNDPQDHFDVPKKEDSLSPDP